MPSSCRRERTISPSRIDSVVRTSTGFSPRAILDQAPAACCIPLGATGMSEEDAGTTAEVFKALADPGRVKIVNLLANAPGPVCVCDLTPELGLSTSTVSFRLQKLVQAGLLVGG